MFPWITVHVMNAYVDNVWICEDDNNSPKENVPPPLPLPYPKIYPIIVPGLISYANTSNFIIVYFGAVHAYGSQCFDLTHLNIEELFLLYDPLQIFWNHNDVVYRSGIIHTSFNKFGTCRIPFHNWFLWFYPGLNLWLLWLQFLLCNTWWDASNIFPCNTKSQ